MSLLTHGLTAGAAGTTALNAVTYLDMTLRGRPASSIPQRDAEQLSEKAGVSLGEGEAADARKQGAGALMGFLTGLGGGIAYATPGPIARRLAR